MKSSILFLVILSLFTFAVSCKKDDKAAIDAATGGGGTTTTTKATLSAWAISNSSFFARLDLNGANLTGVSFTLVIKYADNSEVWCTNTQMTGTEDVGTFNVTGNCTGHGGMSDSVPTAFETGGVGSYTNSGSNLILCRANTSCLTYH